MTVQELYLGCLAGGALFTLITFIFGDLLNGLFDGALDGAIPAHLDFLSPMVSVGAITAFGGCGLILSKYTGMAEGTVFGVSALIAVILGGVLYFGYLKPMKNAENSTGFSMKDLVGKIGEVTTPIPAEGYGEVVLRVGAGSTNQIGASMERKDLPAGIRVVVGEVRESVLYVFRFDEDEE